MAVKGIPSILESQTLTSLASLAVPNLRVHLRFRSPTTYTPVNFRVKILGWHQRNTAEVWGFECGSLGRVELYKWTGTSDPDFSVVVPDDLFITDWVLLATPPNNLQGESFDADGNCCFEECKKIIFCNLVSVNIERIHK